MAKGLQFLCKAVLYYRNSRPYPVWYSHQSSVIDAIFTPRALRSYVAKEEYNEISVRSMNIDD